LFSCTSGSARSFKCRPDGKESDSLMIIAQDYARLCHLVADHIAALIQAKPDAVLGLATGTTPLGVYENLARRHESGNLDFSRVTCFNLDEYYPMSAASPHSYFHFMQEHLFRKINCRRWFLPDGTPRRDAEIALSCRDYEARIAAAGGIDLQILGIGRTGHVGFNEPGSGRNSRTRLVTLHALTRQDAAASFGGLENVPSQAVSMGIGTILEAREIVIMASGAAKADIVRTAWAGEITDHIPASLIRTHPNAHLYLDEMALGRSDEEPLPPCFVTSDFAGSLPC
jgi:glucosamine-6-phosphate deaminase